MIEIYTDGSSRGNPGEGGFGVVVLDNTNIIKYENRQFDSVTNNQMELQAIIYAFKWIKENLNGDSCLLYSDSSYCINSITIWAENWENNNWKRSGNKPVQNLELIKEAYSLFKENKNVVIRKVAGHANVIGNELADKLATNNMNHFNKIVQREGLTIK